MSKRVICFGELMMRLNTPSHQRFSQTEHWESFYGGSESNVAVLLSRLGTPSTLVTGLPENDLGQSALEALRKHGVDTAFIHRGGKRLGLYFTETSNSLRPSRVIYDRSESSFATLKKGDLPWESIFQNAGWFHWSGISAAVSASAAALCLEALQAARKAGVKISADMNHRSTLWKYGKHPSDVMPELLSYCDVITGDIDTTEVYFGFRPASTERKESLRECGELLKKKLPAMQLLAMTFRDLTSEGITAYSGIITDGRTVHFSSAHEITNPIERIGSGDAFMGGLIHALSEALPLPEVIDFAIAAGALKHSIPGEFALLTEPEIRNFMASGDAKGKIIR